MRLGKSSSKKEAASHRSLGEIGASFWSMPEFVVGIANSHHKMPALGGSSTIVMGEVAAFASQLTHRFSLEPTKLDKPLVTKFGFLTERELDAYVDKISYLRGAK